MSTFGRPERRRIGEATPVRHAPIDQTAVPMPTAGPAPAPQLLQVGSAADPQEEQAERTADRVLAILRRSASQPEAPVRRAACSGAPHGAEVGAAGGEIGPATSSAIDRLRGGGRPLAPDVRRRMEGAFGTGFGEVRVHAGPAARELNQRVGARAFTVGHDVVLDAGGADPVTDDDHRVLAHELAHVVQNRAGATAGIVSPLRRLVGFEVELSVPTLRTAATTPLAKVLDGPDPDPSIGTFFAGGLPYATRLGAVPTAHGDIAMKSDHNYLSRDGAALFAAIGAAAPAATAGATYVKLSNLEYATPALDELAVGSNARFRALADAIDTHTGQIMAADPKTTMTDLPRAAGFSTGLPRAAINTWAAPVAGNGDVKAAAQGLVASIDWSMYVQATVGVLPTGLATMYASQAAELPAGDNGDMAAAMREAADTVIRLTAAFDAQPFVATFNESTMNRLTAPDLLALKGIATMAASYAVGNAIGQTALIGGHQKNSVQLLNKLVDMGKVTDALTTRLQRMKGQADNEHVLAFIRGLVNWIHAEPQTGTAHWGAAPYRSPVVRDRIYGKGGGVSDAQATARLVRDFLTGTKTAAEIGPGTPLPANDPAPARAGDVLGQRGIPMETRWTLARPSAQGELWPVFRGIIDQVRAANLAHLGPDARAAALRDL